MTIDLKNRLAQMGEAWKTGKDKSPGVPDGIYTMKLQKAEVGESQAGNLMIKREHVCIEGEYTGVVTRDNLMMETETGPYYVSKWIELMGYEAPSDPVQIAAVVQAIENDAPTYIAEVKVKDDYRNVRIKQLIGEGESASRVQSKPQVSNTPAKPATPSTPKPATKIPKVEQKAEEHVPAGTLVEFSDGKTNFKATIVRMAITEGAPNEYIVQLEGMKDMFQMTRADFAIVTKEPAKEEVVETAASEDTSEFLAFAASHNLEGVTDDLAKEKLVEIICSYEYKRSELTPEEVTFLTSLNATITEPKQTPKPLPKPSPKVVTPTPAAVSQKVTSPVGPQKLIKK